MGSRNDILVGGQPVGTGVAERNMWGLTDGGIGSLIELSGDSWLIGGTAYSVNVIRRRYGYIYIGVSNGTLVRVYRYSESMVLDTSFNSPNGFIQYTSASTAKIEINDSGVLGVCEGLKTYAYDSSGALIGNANVNTLAGYQIVVDDSGNVYIFCGASSSASVIRKFKNTDMTLAWEVSGGSGTGSISGGTLFANGDTAAVREMNTDGGLYTIAIDSATGTPLKLSQRTHFSTAPVYNWHAFYNYPNAISPLDSGWYAKSGDSGGTPNIAKLTWSGVDAIGSITVQYSYDCGVGQNDFDFTRAGEIIVCGSNVTADEDGETAKIRIFSPKLSKLRHFTDSTDVLPVAPLAVSTSFFRLFDPEIYDMAKEQAVWFSETGDYENFEEGVKDADSFSLTVQTMNDIIWIEGVEALLLGTAGDEWKIGSTRLDQTITPTNFSIKKQSSFGCLNIQDVLVNETVLFADYVGRKLREFTFSDQQQKYVAPDLTALAEHITKGGITNMAYQRNPDSILWVVLDGELISLVYEREQNVVSWSKHPMPTIIYAYYESELVYYEDELVTTQNDTAVVMSVCVTPAPLEDEITISVGRTIDGVEHTFIERFASRTLGDNIKNHFFVDCGITTTAPAGTITLAHLVGQTVGILADGVVMDDAVVGAAGLTYVKKNGVTTNATVVQAGLKYTSKLQPTTLVFSTQAGTSQLQTKRIPKLSLSLLNTANIKYGDSTSELYDVNLTTPELVNSSDIIGLYTGSVDVTMPGGFSSESPIIISTDAPLPATIRCIVADVTKTG